MTVVSDGSMLLLTRLAEDALDQGYADAARRRGPDAPPTRGWVLTVALVAVGLLLTTAAVQARERASASNAAREAIIAEIEDRQATNDTLERALHRLRADVSESRQRSLRLTEQGAAVAAALGRLEVATGVGAVRGPGMVLTLEDAAPTDDPADAGTDKVDDGRVTDRDLQTLVNETWAAGAEAVAVNGQRLTVLSAIRAAGEAILVDFRPVAPPYVVEAVGPPNLRSRLASGFAGSYLTVLRDYGITYALEDRDDLRLPASAGVALRHATAAVGSGPR